AQRRRTIGRVANRVNGYPTTAVEAVSSGVSQKTARGIIHETSRIRPKEQPLLGHAPLKAAADNVTTSQDPPLVSRMIRSENRVPLFRILL
ncbi:MAG TPA: hypothetical protein VGZ89_19805, partial [Xanthobacteraceae bacterium]|nr:hypothetical protein [Xanthobacteraceae bacterium]